MKRLSLEMINNLYRGSDPENLLELFKSSGCHACNDFMALQITLSSDTQSGKRNIFMTTALDCLSEY